MLIGAAVREGAARGVKLTPLFSLYSYHGPVFRVMLHATRSKEGMDTRQYSYVGHCYVHGESYRVGWRGLSQAWCR
jgi:tRNA (guanine26-N2/guanine27-N2)-dimethyltransferase